MKCFDNYKPNPKERLHIQEHIYILKCRSFAFQDFKSDHGIIFKHFEQFVVHTGFLSLRMFLSLWKLQSKYSLQVRF